MTVDVAKTTGNIAAMPNVNSNNAKPERTGVGRSILAIGRSTIAIDISPEP